MFCVDVISCSSSQQIQALANFQLCIRPLGILGNTPSYRLKLSTDDDYPNAIDLHVAPIMAICD